MGDKGEPLEIAFTRPVAKLGSAGRSVKLGIVKACA